jgi:hypothetical protein
MKLFEKVKVHSQHYCTLLSVSVQAMLTFFVIFIRNRKQGTRYTNPAGFFFAERFVCFGCPSKTKKARSTHNLPVPVKTRSCALQFGRLDMPSMLGRFMVQLLNAGSLGMPCDLLIFLRASQKPSQDEYIAEGANPNQANIFGFTPLHLAAWRNNLEGGRALGGV